MFLFLCQKDLITEIYHKAIRIILQLFDPRMKFLSASQDEMDQMFSFFQEVLEIILNLGQQTRCSHQFWLNLNLTVPLSPPANGSSLGDQLHIPLNIPGTSIHPVTAHGTRTACVNKFTVTLRNKYT